MELCICQGVYNRRRHSCGDPGGYGGGFSAKALMRHQGASYFGLRHNPPNRRDHIGRDCPSVVCRALGHRLAASTIPAVSRVRPCFRRALEIVQTQNVSRRGFR